ncbi:ATP-dependent exoDNAse (exonuclease V) alpha subunit [Mesorhizobium jarvisii]
MSFVEVQGDGIAQAVERVSDDLGGFGQGELMVVTATNGGPAGIDELNSLLPRRHVTRHGHTVVKGTLGQWFAPGDPCIHLRNDYSLGLFNGSTGQVVEVSEGERAVTAEIDGRRFRFVAQIIGDNPEAADGDLVDLGLAYALTCHKAQGSQCARVIVPVYRTALLTPSWLYTAVTRAERQVVLVGEREAIELALARPWVGEARTVGFRPIA